jgi:hypothetical protein
MNNTSKMPKWVSILSMAQLRQALGLNRKQSTQSSGASYWITEIQGDQLTRRKTGNPIRIDGRVANVLINGTPFIVDQATLIKALRGPDAQVLKQLIAKSVFSIGRTGEQLKRG